MHTEPEPAQRHTTAELPEFPPDDPTLSRTPVTQTSFHRAIGLTVRFETNDPRIHRAAVESFGPSVECVSPADAVIRIFVHHVDEEPGFSLRNPLVRSFEGTFWIAASRSSVISGSILTGQVVGFLSETVVGNAGFLRSVFVQTAFLMVAHARSIAVVHSACLARDGRAVMLRGDSGAGKSTLAYAALQRGYALIAEDVVFLRSRSGQTTGTVTPGDLQIHGLPWMLHLLPDAANLFPELARVDTIERPDGRHKLVISIADRFPGQALPDAPLGPLVFVARSQYAKPRLSTLTRDDALARLNATAIHYERDEDAEHRLWDAVLSQPVYLLETSSDPHANAAMLDHVLNE